MREPVLYYGNSMRRVFRDGDLLVSYLAEFDALVPGDVILFFSPEKKKNVVHRIIEKKDGCIRTIGDNNEHPDPWKLTAETDIFLVIGRVDLKSKEHRIRGGAAGMREYYYHRFCRSVRKFFGKIYHLLLPLCFFRRELPAPEKSGEDFCHYWRGHLIARSRDGRRVRFSHWLWKLFFRMPKEDSLK